MSRRKRGPAKLTKVEVTLPFGIGRAEWEAEEAEIRAAWALYVELSTRVAVQPIEKGKSSIREALQSLHCIFESTRQVLKDAGPSVARGPVSFGPIAIDILNKGLRPFLAKWHTSLLEHEGARPPGVDEVSHEVAWSDYDNFYDELGVLQQHMSQYVAILGDLAGAAD